MMSLEGSPSGDGHEEVPAAGSGYRGSSGAGVGAKSRDSKRSQGDGKAAASRQADPVPQPTAPESLRARSPLYFAQHAGRYQRQILIRDYQTAYDCRLIVMI